MARYRLKKTLASLLLIALLCAFPAAEAMAFTTTAQVEASSTDLGSGSAPDMINGGDDYDIVFSQSGDLETDMGRIFDGLTDIVAAVGAVIFSFGLGKLFLSFKDDRPEEKASAINLLVAGIMVMTIDGIMKTLLSTT